MSENRQINDEAQKAFDEAKKYFGKFSDIDWMGPDQIKIAPDALPEISDAEQAKRIEEAMERLYGDKSSKDPTDLGSTII